MEQVEIKVFFLQPGAAHEDFGGRSRQVSPQTSQHEGQHSATALGPQARFRKLLEQHGRHLPRRNCQREVQIVFSKEAQEVVQLGQVACPEPGNPVLTPKKGMPDFDRDAFPKGADFHAEWVVEQGRCRAHAGGVKVHEKAVYPGNECVGNMHEAMIVNG